MRYKIRDIGDEGLAIQEPVTAAWLGAECPDLEAKPAGSGIAVRGRLEKSGSDTFLLRADLKGSLATSCSRCLEPATVALDVPMVSSYVERDEAAADEDEGASEDGDVHGFSDGVIDLGPAVRDEILLAMPISPLCKEDCAGICPLCGGNRNTTPCDCVDRQQKAQSKFSEALEAAKLSVKD